jgi:diacylglycerol kinase (ATP)
VKIRFILNPVSGPHRAHPAAADRARRFLSEHRLNGTVVSTERPGHATELAEKAVEDGCTHVVAIGGDGTLNEVAAALVDRPVVFGLIPCGSGNGLGRHLGIRGPGEDAFHTLLHGRMHRIDTGSVNGLPFFNSMGLGYEAEITRKFASRTNRGLAGYFRAGLPLFFSQRPETCTVKIGKLEHRLTILTLAVMNSDQYGNDAVLAPGARVDDGKLHVVGVAPVGILGAGLLLARIAAGRASRSPAVTRLSGEHFAIERPLPGWIHVDGEPRRAEARLGISIRPRSLRMMVPRDYPATGTTGHA